MSERSESRTGFITRVLIPVVVQVDFQGYMNLDVAESLTLRKLDAFREAVEPSANYGLTIYQHGRLQAFRFKPS